jgi:hypothetical protein
MTNRSAKAPAGVMPMPSLRDGEPVAESGAPYELVPATGEPPSLSDQLSVPTYFPPVVRAEDMHRESIRDGWIMGEHPVRFLRGNDHE